VTTDRTLLRLSLTLCFEMLVSGEGFRFQLQLTDVPIVVGYQDLWKHVLLYEIMFSSFISRLYFLSSK